MHAGQAKHDANPAILVADDEEPIRQVLVAQMSARGYRVFEAGTGSEVLRAVQRLLPDVVILDLGLPDIDGFEVTRRIRAMSPVPVIILSVRTAESDKIAALDAGADDYLSKPWQTGELIERTRAALLRETMQADRIFHCGDLAVDLQAGMVQIGSNRIQLTAKEYGLLKVFVLNAGRLLTQRRLTREAWGERWDDDVLQLLRATVASLRQKLEINPARPRLITTEPGVGFRMRVEP